MNDIEILKNMRDNIYGAMQFEDDYQVSELEEKEFNALNLAITALKERQEDKEKIKDLRTELYDKKDIVLNQSKRIKELEKSILLESKPTILGMIPISELKEIVNECIPKQENIITKELEYTPNVNDNSYLTQKILELLEEDIKE